MSTELVPYADIPGYEEFIRELEERTFGDVHNWDDFELKFLRGRGLSVSTYENTRAALRQFFEEFLRMRVSPFRVTVEMIEKWYDHIYTTRSPATAGVRISQLRSFYTRFCEMYPCRNPFVNIPEALAKKFRPKVERKKVRYLTEAELKKLWDFLLGPQEYPSMQRWCRYMHVLLKFLVNTGLRAFECVQLRRADFERRFERDQQFRWYCRFVGKGGGRAEQYVPDECFDLLMDLWQQRKGRLPEDHEYVWFHPEPIVYQTTYTPERLSTDNMDQCFAVLTKRVNEGHLFQFEVYLRPHGMRHTFATILLEEKGVDVRKVQLALRHKSLDTTTSTYLHDEPPRTYAPI